MVIANSEKIGNVGLKSMLDPGGKSRKRRHKAGTQKSLKDQT
jgi:hypothetical protein